MCDLDTCDLSRNFKMSSCDYLKTNQPECLNRLLDLRLSLSPFNSLFSVIGANQGSAANPRQKMFKQQSH